MRKLKKFLSLIFAACPKLGVPIGVVSSFYHDIEAHSSLKEK